MLGNSGTVFQHDIVRGREHQIQAKGFSRPKVRVKPTVATQIQQVGCEGVQCMSTNWLLAVDFDGCRGFQRDGPKGIL
jgi:hypothetical protein